LLFVPFHTQFVSRVTSVGVMTEGNTLITTYLGFWTHMLLPLTIAAVLFAAVRGDGRISLKRTILFCSFFMLSVAAALYLTRANLFGFPSPMDPEHPLNYSLVGLFLPVFLVIFLMMWRRRQSPEFVFACLAAVLGLGLSLGIEVFHIKENPWGPPAHRWNTAFKFNLQVWLYLSIAASVSCVWVWSQIEKIGRHIGGWFTWSGRLAFLFAMILVLIPTLPFAVLGPVLVTKAGGYSSDMREPRPTLDGLAYLQKDDPGAYKAIHWFKRFVEGRPPIVELSYRHGGDHARYSSYTGLPALIGWPHHTRERMDHVAYTVNQRVRDMERIYTSNDQDEVLRLLGQYDLQYLIFGRIEKNTLRGDQSNLAPLGEDGLQHIEDMGGIFQLVFRCGDTSVFKIDKSLNRIYGLASEAARAGDMTPPALRPPAPGASMYTGGRGDGNGRFYEPRGIVTDAAGGVFVADARNHRVQVFRPDGSYAWKFGEEGSRDGQLREPNDAALDPENGNIYVLDTWNHRVSLFDANGIFLGKTAHDFFGPRGIVFHPQKRLLYITDAGHHQIVAITPEGKIARIWGKKGEEEDSLNEPWGIDVTPDGNVIVVDHLNLRTRIYTPEGDLIGGWPIQTEGRATGGFESYVACADDGLIYLTDPLEGSVHVYNQAGELQDKIVTDLKNRRLRRPLGVAISPQGHVLASDLAGDHIVRIR
ncbi:MAG: 6-bladed beta-propeller, partial [Candidatus Omnitrophica bacterium]|nr:6-bladed beta-propeller [Candidatus Omnitrophota bacterium]